MPPQETIPSQPLACCALSALGLGLTYVTGGLVKVGQLIAAALTGGARFGWLPNLLSWAALVAGGVLGALACLDQSRRDLVCRSLRAGFRRARCCNGET